MMLRLSIFVAFAAMAAGQSIVSPELDDIVFPGTASPVLYGIGTSDYPVRSEDGGQTWTPLYVFPAGTKQNITGIVVDPVNPQVVYVSAQMNRGGVWKSTNGGQTWTQRSTGLPAGSETVQSLTIAANNAQVLYVRVGVTLYKSTDGAATWTSHGNLPLTAGLLKLLPTTPTQGYLFGDKGTMFRSTDDAKTWAPRTQITLDGTVDPEVRPGCLTIDPSNPAIVYVCVDVPAFVFHYLDMVGIWRSTDGATTWTKIGRNSVNASRILIDPRDGNTIHLFYGDNNGYMRSTNHGQSFAFTSLTFSPTALDPRNPAIIYANEGTLISRDAGVSSSATNAVFRPTFLTATDPISLTLQAGQAVTLPVEIKTAEFIRSAVTVSATESASWLTLQSGFNSTWTGLRVSFSSAGLAAGTYDATIQLTSTQTTGPGSIPVRLTVVPALTGPSYTLTTFAGGGLAATESPDGTPATGATLPSLGPIAYDSNGDMYFVSKYRVRKVDSAGMVRTVAGNGTFHLTGPNGNGGGALDASFGFINGLAIDKQGRIFISDDTLRVVENGTVRTFADKTEPGDKVYGWSGLEFAANGDLYIASINGILRIPAGQTRPQVVVGTPSGILGYQDVAVAADGTLYILPSFATRVYRLRPGSALTPIAGTGTWGFNGDGLATNAQINSPSAIEVDTAGNVWIIDSINKRIRVLTPDGNLRTVAGGGTNLLGTGIGAIDASLSADASSDLAFDPQGNIVFSEGLSFRRLTKDTIPRPYAAAGSFVNAGSNLPNLSPGVLFSFYGQNMATSTAVAAGSPWPTTLGGATVRINGIPVPLFYAGPTQINGQVPYNLTVGSRPNATVTVNGLASGNVSFLVSNASPGILVFGDNRAVVVNPNGSVNTAATPGKAGEVLVAYFTGTGLVNNAVATGVAAPNAPLSEPLLPVKIYVGATLCKTLFLGLTPGFIGLGQANFELPNLPPGDYPLTIVIGDQTSNGPFLSIGR